jgi:Helix-loop-helix DNA-binding domain
MDGLNQTANNGNNINHTNPANGQLVQQQPPNGTGAAADALNAAAMQQAIAAFQASVEQAVAANGLQNPLFAVAQQQQQLAFPTPSPPAAPAPAAGTIPNPLLMANHAAAVTQSQQQQLWQQAWLSALLPAPQAALTQPYLAAALNPLQPQLLQQMQLQLQQQQQLQPQQLQPQQPAQLLLQPQQQVPAVLLPQPPLVPAAARGLLPAKRKAAGFTSSTNTSFQSDTTQQQQRPGRNRQAATVVSNDCTLEKEPIPKSEAELLLMTQSERRRYERNLREQQRSYKISQQIKLLRDVLEESNIPFRPNKYSILVNVAEYIKQLQSRAIMLDSEHQRLIDTIKYTTEKSSSLLSSSSPGNSTILHHTTLQHQQFQPQPALESDAPLVQGLDYKNVFFNARFPLGVATLDGRVLACSRQMERLLRHQPHQAAATTGSTTTNDAAGGSSLVVDQSFFVFIRNHQEIFEAMADLLKRSTATIETGEGTITKTSRLLFWCGHILSSTNQTVRTGGHVCIESSCPEGLRRRLLLLSRTNSLRLIFFLHQCTVSLYNHLDE